MPKFVYPTLNASKERMSDQLKSIIEQTHESDGIETNLKSKKNDDESDKLLDLLKKTQSQVSSLENEITRVKAKNIHQE